MFAEGDADMDLAADLLANGKTSRLYRKLVEDERIDAVVGDAEAGIEGPVLAGGTGSGLAERCATRPRRST